MFVVVVDLQTDELAVTQRRRTGRLNLHAQQHDMVHVTYIHVYHIDTTILAVTSGIRSLRNFAEDIPSDSKVKIDFMLNLNRFSFWHLDQINHLY